MRGMLTFLRDDRGSQTIEFVLWLPIIVSLMVIITDASILYLTQTEMWNVARDTARRLSSGQLKTENAAVIYANQQLNLYDPAYVVTATRDRTNGVVTSMTVVITVDVADAAIFGYFLTPVLGSAMEARVRMRYPSLVLATATSTAGGGSGGGGDDDHGDDDDHGNDDDHGYNND